MLDLKDSTYPDVRPHKRTLLHRFELWMINDGKMYIYLGFWVLLQALLYSLAAVNYSYYPLWQNMHILLGGSFIGARSAALVLHINTALVLLPICRTVISWIRTTPLNRVIPFDHALLFHKLVGYSIILFALVHTGSHYRNYWVVATVTGTPYWRMLFTTGHSITGHIMLFIMIIMGVTGWAKIRRKHFNLFWNLHHLYIIYFACFSIHGGFCLLKSNLPPFCSTGAAFWKYWLFSGVVYLFERLSREFRANVRAKTMKVQKVILHPGKVIEVQFRKPRGFKGLAGQYAFLNCPAVSTQQWHPFTLTSAPEEDYVSVHVRVVGDWTKSFAAALGANDEHWKALEASLGDSDTRGRKAKRPETASKDTTRPPRLDASAAAAAAAAAGRDSMAYAPLSARKDNRERRNTALMNNRPNTMLLVDQSGGGGGNFEDMMAAGGGGGAGSLASRLSQYISGSRRGSMGARQRSRGSLGAGAFSGQPMEAHDASNMPTLKQLQDHYLREEQQQQQRRGRGDANDAGSSSSSSGNASGSTAAEDRDMDELRAIVNGEKDDEWESMPVGISNRLAGPTMEPHQTASILPQVLVDGPFGSASEDVFNHEIAMLFCAGIGCTPFASVLKSIWYRLSYPEGSFRLRKVYFFWTQRDTKSFEWFQDLLKAIEEEDEARMEINHDDGAYSMRRAAATDSMIEIHTYLTGKLNFTQMTHVHLNVGDVDPITGLRSPTKFGRPNLDIIFRAVAHEHPASDVGVFFCGPHKMGSNIASMAKKWSGEGQDGTKFYYNKENF